MRNPFKRSQSSPGTDNASPSAPDMQGAQPTQASHGVEAGLGLWGSAQAAEQVANDTMRFAAAPEPARRAQTGTSYTASGVSATNDIQQPDLLTELGSSQPTIIQELVPELASPFTRQQTYAKMMNDAGVSVSMRAMKTPVLGAEFYVDAYSSNPQDAEIADFVWSNLAEGMSAPLINSLEDILHMYEDGYAILEKVHENREWTARGVNRNTRVYTMLRKLAVRPAATIKQIDYDNNGGPVKITQSAIQADKSVVDKDMPINKICIFTFERKGGDLTGKSLLRTAYPHWYYKSHFYKIDAVAKERHGIGIPKGKLLAGFNTQDRVILRQLLRNIRSNEESFVIETPNVEVSFLQLSGEPVNVLESAEHHNNMILLNVMAQFLALGLSGQGSRAVGGTQSDIFMKSLRYVANSIADVINMYVIPELVVWNYPTRNFPKLKVRNIGETRDLQMLASALSNLLSQQGITMDEPTEQWIRGVFDMPTKQTDGQPSPASQVNQPQTPPNAANGNQPQPPPPAQSAPPPPQKGGVGQPGPGNVGKPQNAPQ